MMIGCAVLLLAACDKDERGESNIMIRLTDAPAAYQQVNVDIQKVRAHVVDNNGNGTWHDLNTNAGIYDLLTLQNGIDTTLADFTAIPAGSISQMRLVLGPNNTVMADSVMHSLKVPSGEQSGVKLNGNIQANANQTLVILLDFDAHESVVEGGNGEFHLKPVIKVMP